jgi:tetratricopeptide (TPR) repeat protein
MELVMWVAFAVFFVLTIVWRACARRLARMIGERHPGKYDRMSLGDIEDASLLGSSDDTEKADMAVMRFLWRREYYRMQDDEIVKLAHGMRWLLVGLGLSFAAFGSTVVMTALEPGDAPEVAAVAAPQAQLAEARSRAFELHRQNRLPEALALYDQLVDKGPPDAEVTYYRGNARAASGQHDLALVDYRRVMDLDPAHFAAHLNTDRILSRQRRWDDCIDVWNRYLRVVPRDAEAYYERGGSHFRKGDVAQSILDLKRSCELGKAAACARAEALGRKP